MMQAGSQVVVRPSLQSIADVDNHLVRMVPYDGRESSVSSIFQLQAADRVLE